MHTIFRVSILALIGASLVASSLSAQRADSTVSSDTAIKATFGGFVDGYYAYDFNRPPNFDRSYTTQPARHNEFNVNLVFVEARVDGQRVHGRVALQAGTSVQANYAAEPTVGSVSGPDISQFIQEAFAGYKVANHLWVDAGIFFSHIGNESFISRDNWTYSRSLTAEYTPYYEAGVRAVWQAGPNLTAAAVVVNGWQNISETNSSKAVGVRLDYTPSSAISLTYDNFFGNEQPDSLPSRLRILNELIAKVQLTSRFAIAATGDYGVQPRLRERGSDTWHGATLMVRYQAMPRVALNGRVEYFGDPGQVLISVPIGAHGFRSAGASIGIDVMPQPRFAWRTELRSFGARDPVFQGSHTTAGLSKQDGFVVTSFGLTL